MTSEILAMQTAAPPRPVALKVNLDGIPHALKELIIFCLWKYVLKGDKWTKVPYQPNGRHADSTKRNTWSDYEDVMATYLLGGYDGIGLFFDQDYEDSNAIFGVDIDDCIDDHGVVSDNALAAIKHFNSYAELSPSATGIHVLAKCHGVQLTCNRRNEFEIYKQQRFFTLTGHVYDNKNS